MSFTLKSWILLLFVLVGLLDLTRSVPANDLTDVSSTSIGIAETNSSHFQRLVVAVQRIDDLVDSDGNVVAEKISAVIMNFELNDKNELTLNSKPVELGISSIQTIEARIMPADVKVEDIQKYEDSFDIGLVTVQIRSFIEAVPTQDEGTSVSKITVVVKILELNGVQIVQSDAVERVVVFQLLEVTEGKQKSQLVPVDAAAEENKSHRIVHWWKCSSKFFKIFIISFTLTLLFGSLFLLLIPLAVNNLKLQNKFNEYKKILQESEFGDNESPQVEQVIFIADEEKHALMGKDHQSE